jgi:hypothetical protein
VRIRIALAQAHTNHGNVCGFAIGVRALAVFTSRAVATPPSRSGLLAVVTNPDPAEA